MNVTQLLAIPRHVRSKLRNNIYFNSVLLLYNWHVLLQIFDVPAAHFHLWVNGQTANKEFRRGWIGGAGVWGVMHLRTLLFQSVSQNHNVTFISVSTSIRIQTHALK